jgi:hypothetical protein
VNPLPWRAGLAVLAGSALLTTGAALTFAMPGAAALRVLSRVPLGSLVVITP